MNSVIIQSSHIMISPKIKIKIKKKILIANLIIIIKNNQRCQKVGEKVMGDAIDCDDHDDDDDDDDYAK